MLQIFSLCVYEKLQGLSQKAEIYQCLNESNTVSTEVCTRP